MAASSWAKDRVALKAPKINTNNKNKRPRSRNLRAVTPDLPLSISQFLSVGEFVLLARRVPSRNGIGTEWWVQQQRREVSSERKETV
jgi:hypothetical protein